MKAFLIGIALSFFMVNPVYSGDPIPFTGTITGDVTLDVPADFAGVAEALDYLTDKTIAGYATVTIQVADGTYTALDPIEVNHVNGDRIAILGNTTNPALVNLEFVGIGFMVHNGNKLGLLDGFTLKGSGTGAGAYATTAASMILGQNMVIREFNQGVHVNQGANIQAIGVRSMFNQNNGFLCNNATLNASNAEATDNNISGIVASNGGSATFANGLAERNGLYGLQVYRMGTLDAGGAASNSNGHFGFLAQLKSLIYAPGATASGNGIRVTEVQTDSMISL